MNTKYFRPFVFGLLAAAALLAIYFTAITLISGWAFAVDQFFQFWYFVVVLAVGFGIQIGLYIYLKNAVHHSDSSGKVLAVSGGASTGAMISCCAHYLVNILPVLGVTGFVSIIGQYQVELFWVGLLFNLGGIAYISSKVIKFKKIQP